MRTTRRRGAAAAKASNAPFALISRTALFNLLAGLVLGIALGLFYTWVISPVEYTDTGPDSLRADYKNDYVIMIARTYLADGDLDSARSRLAPLNLSNPGQFTADLTTTQIQTGAAPDDLRALSALTIALGAIPPPLP
jgi:hypothetical protein